MKPSLLLGTLRGSDRLAPAILAQADCDFLCLHGAVAADLAARGLPATALDAFLTEDLRRLALGEASRRTAAAAQVVRTPAFRERYGGLSDGAWERVTAVTLSTLERDAGEVILLTELIRHAALHRDIRALVVQEDYGRDTRTAVQSCRRYGIPSLHILHGIPYQTQAGHDVFEADVVAAQGTRARDALVRLGHDPGRIVLTGGMEWDRYGAPLTDERKTAARAALGLDPARPVVGYASTFTHAFSAVSARHPAYHDATTAAVLGAFGELAGRHRDWQFVVRPHPGDTDGASRMAAMASEAGAPPVAWSVDDPYDFLAACDAVGCVQSNIGVEALLLGKPVVNVAIEAFAAAVFEEGLGSLFRREDPVEWAAAIDAIAPALERAMTQHAQRDAAFLESLCFRTDGGALDRIAACVVEMMAAPERYVRGPARLPEMERALALAVPEGAARIRVLGSRARYTAEALARLHPMAQIDWEGGLGAYDAVVLSDPLPHSADAEAGLEEARALIGPEGAIVACAYHGGVREAEAILRAGLWGVESRSDVPLTAAGQFSLGGMDILLSRLDLVRDGLVAARESGPRRTGRLTEHVEAFAVRAAVRRDGPSAFAAAERAALERAEALNSEGEALFAAGDAAGALAQFAQAIAASPGYAVAHNNLGTALAALGRAEEAYDRVRDALHYDPNLPAARENLRALAGLLGLTNEAERLLGLFGRD